MANPKQPVQCSPVTLNYLSPPKKCKKFWRFLWHCWCTRVYLKQIRFGDRVGMAPLEGLKFWGQCPVLCIKVRGPVWDFSPHLLDQSKLQHWFHNTERLKMKAFIALALISVAAAMVSFEQISLFESKQKIRWTLCTSIFGDQETRTIFLQV